MIQVENLTLAFSGEPLFENVNAKFINENCYGLIGANGAGKSTFLKILSGEIEPTQGQVIIPKDKRLSILRQDQFAYDEWTVLDTVLQGHEELYEIYKERNELYSKPEMTEEEGLRVADLEYKFGEMDGYMAEVNASTMLADLGIDEELQSKQMKNLESTQKIRVLLAQALFGNPDILLLDEPTNQLDYQTVLWLENFLMDFQNTVIVVSHDRHFLNKVCTHIADLDFKKLSIYTGNYDFWYQSSQLMMEQQRNQNKKKTDKIKELEDFIRRFSANASKSKQATSRKKLLDKLRPEELPVSSRRTPFIHFKPNRNCGNKILKVTNVSHSIDGEKVLHNVSFSFNKFDKVALVGRNTLSKTTLLQILAGEIQPDEGEIEWGETITHTYFPKDNSEYFSKPTSLIDWLSTYTTETDTQEIRGYLGRMLFSGDDAKKPVNVLSGGEKARAMFSKMMIQEANFIMFDEPTDHLDLEAITAINKAMETFGECMIFTSHDFKLMDTVANRIIEVSPKGMIDRPMSFSDYMESERIQKLRAEL